MKGRIAIVQARMGSHRFPGKSMARLGRWTLIHWVLARLAQAQSLAEIVLATSLKTTDDVLVEEARAIGIHVFRGDEHDVLGRFRAAASSRGAISVVRVCADNPFVAAEEVDRLSEFFHRDYPDLAFNHVPRNENQYPNGLGAEIFSAKCLEALDHLAVEERHREHVTLLAYEQPTRFRVATFPAPEAIAAPEIRLDVDTPEDLARLSRLPCVEDLYCPANQIVQDYRRVFGRGKS